MPLPSSAHQPAALGNERDFHIVEREGKWCLVARSTGKTLGCHDTRAGAEAQERVVQANKHSQQAEITYEQMRAICPPCADKMLAQRMKAVKLDFTKRFAGLSPQALAGLCDKFGDAAGFRTRCMDSAIDVSDLGAFCNWLKEQCHGSVSEKSDSTQVREHAVGETHNINGVEIFAAGEWNGDKYTESDIEGMVQAFKETKDELKPYVKLGHSEEQTLLAADSLPAAGWISGVYRQGSKLLADIRDIPAKVFDLVKAGAYKRVSSEIFVNVKVGGKTYPYALKAVAFLGGETPAVQTLEDVHALYAVDAAVLAYGKQAEAKAYLLDLAQTMEEVREMAEEKDMLGKPTPAQVAVAEGEAPAVPHIANTAPEPHAEPDGDECYKMLKQAHGELDDLRKQMAAAAPAAKQAETQMSAYRSENSALKQELEGVKGELGKAQGDLARIHKERNASEVKAIVAKFVEDKKILPAQAQALEALLLSARESGVRKFKAGETEFESEEALIKDFVGKGGNGLSTDPKSESGRSIGAADPYDGDAVSEAVKQYMARTGERSYALAYTAVMREIEGQSPKKD